jgi:hypothetical protein
VRSWSSIGIDIFVGIVAIGFAGFILHNASSVEGTLATVTDIFSTGTSDIKS